ncbi:MAG: formate dehydrogenase subunit alpha, partial [Deltaproteobacteria bacterium]|nr:formate dehydrogenase subunit alpha [Deltaproteobacteria bacterium]
PLVRMDGELRESSWEEALAFVVRRLGEIKAAHGPDVLGGFASAKCTNEENYLFQKLMRACLGTNNVDHCARLCHASTVAGLAQAFGSGAMTNSIGEIRHAECILVIGSNTTEAHPVIGLLIKEAVRKNGARLIVADPRRIELAGLAKLHLRQRPGTDVALVNALMHEILRQGLHKQEFIAERTEGFAELAASLQDYSPERMAEVTGVAVEQIRAAARLFAGAPSAAIVYSMGITQHSTGTDNVLALANLAMLTGNLGRPGAGVNPLRGQNNVQGACDMGALPVVYPGYQPVASDAVRQRFEAAWGVKLSEKPGLTMMEMMHGLETGRLKALYIMGENPALSDPNLNRTWEALRRAELLVVQDIFLTETAELAHVVLPSCCFAEKEGTFTNTERRVQRVRQAVRPPGEARDDWRILCDISTALGYPMAYDGPEAILREVAALAPIYGGITYPRIAEIGLQWPCPDVQHPGTPILHRQTFTRGKGRFHAVRFIEPAEQPEEQFPLLLTTGRLLHQFHTGTLSRKSCVIRQASPEGCLEIHPD